MSYTFRPAVREEVGLLIALIGASGSGKTYSAYRLAAGICGDDPFAAVDTENRRGLHYADKFRFDYGEIREPFRPESYIEAILAADKAGYRAIVVDSMSHVWAGPGGVLDWQEEELQRMAGDDWKKRESCKMAAWIKPKLAHKAMVQRLLQVRANLILCFRAEEKVKMEKDAQGKTQIIPVGWQPICDKNLPYEMTVSLLFTPDAPGIPKPIKLQEQHKPLFPLDRLVDESSGKRISEWAKGGAKPEPKPAESSAQIRSRLEQDIADASDRLALNPIGTVITTYKSQLNTADFTALRAAWKKRAEELASDQKPTQPAPEPPPVSQDDPIMAGIQVMLSEMYPDSPADQSAYIEQSVGRAADLGDLTAEERTKLYDELCNEQP